MYIFRRTRAVNRATVPEARAFAVEIAKKASGVTGRPVSAQEALFGPQPGTISWTTPVTSMADMGELMAKLEGDAGFVAAVAAGVGFFDTAAEDSLFQFLANSIESTDDRYYSGLSAVARAATMPDAVAFGLKSQAYMQEAGFATAFGPSTYGPVGELGWIVAANSMEELDRLHEFMATDAGYAALGSEAADLFEPGSGMRQLSRQLG